MVKFKNKLYKMVFNDVKTVEFRTNVSNEGYIGEISISFKDIFNIFILKCKALYNNHIGNKKIDTKIFAITDNENNYNIYISNRYE